MFFFPLTKTQIESLQATDFESLSFLDANGIFPAENENFDEFHQRLLELENDISEINNLIYNDINTNNNNKKYVIPELKLTANDTIESIKFSESATYTKQYSFSLDWAPGFYSNKSIGFLAGAATLISETGLPIFIIKSVFRKKRKWLLYTISELLSHEFCHVARAPLKDKHYEEFFAYKISPSKFRKYTGGLFHSPLDSLIMLIPFLILLLIVFINIIAGTQISEIYFWILTFVFPAFLFFRNKYYINKYTKAFKALKQITEIKFIDSILFRCTETEIKEISKFSDKKDQKLNYLIHKFSSKKLRWKIISKKFIPVNSN